MAVIFDNLQKLSSTFNSQFPKIWGYTDTTTTQAAMIASGFFNDFIGKTELISDDMMLLKGSDGALLYKYIVTGGNTSLVVPTAQRPRTVLTNRMDIASTGLQLVWLPVPEDGILTTFTGIVTAGTTVTDVFELNYRGTPVASIDLQSAFDPGAARSVTVSVPIEASATVTPEGLQVRTTSNVPQARSFLFSTTIEVSNQ